MKRGDWGYVLDPSAEERGFVSYLSARGIGTRRYVLNDGFDEQRNAAPLVILKDRKDATATATGSPVLLINSEFLTALGETLRKEGVEDPYTVLGKGIALFLEVQRRRQSGQQ
jgi:hypothetical protein